jgi:hypothetical protein
MVVNGRKLDRFHHQVSLWYLRWYLFSHPDDGGDTLLQKVSFYKSNTAQHPRRRNSL